MSNEEMAVFSEEIQPMVEKRAGMVFRFSPAKEEMIQDSLIHAFFICLSSSRRGVFENLTPFSVSTFATKSVASGRTVPCEDKIPRTDALHKSREVDEYEDDFYYSTLKMTSRLRDPKDIVAERVDMYDFQRTLPEKLQQVLDLLLLEYRPLDVTSKFSSRLLGRKLVVFMRNEIYAKKIGLK